MKFGRMLAVSLAVVVITAASADAQRRRPSDEPLDPSRPGPILGVGAVYALENFDGIGMSTDDSGAYNATVGYRFNARFASDLRVERYQEFDSPTGEVNGWAVGVNGRGYILTGDYQPFVLIGINYMDMETTNSAAANPNKTDDGPAMRFGVGFDWYATEKFVLTTDVSYMLGLGEVEDYDLVAFSLGFHFRP